MARVEALRGRLVDVDLMMCCRLLRLVYARREVLVQWVVLSLRVGVSLGIKKFLWVREKSEI